jgi:hypothetical protein
MNDISSISTDLGLIDSQAPRARNILSVQLGSLEYQKDLGIDLAFFLSEDYSFQNDSFKAYLIQVLSGFGINVSSVVETIDNLYSTYTFNLIPESGGSSLVN